MSYAILKTGGKQYRAEEGAEIVIERLEAESGSKVEFDQVLLVNDNDNIKIGQPTVKGAVVEGEIMCHKRGRKVISFKLRRRQGNAQTKIGHRQWETHVKVTGVKYGA